MYIIDYIARIRTGAFFSLLVILNSCASYTGVAELEVYKSSFDKNYIVSSAILDRLGAKERELYFQINPISHSSFEPALVAYYADYVDPPATAAFRHSMELVRTYNDLLFSLATGEPAAKLAARVRTLDLVGSQAQADVAKLQKALPSSASAELTRVTSGLIASIAPATEFLEVALKHQSRDDFRTFAIRYHKTVRGVLVELSNSSREIYLVLINSEANQVKVDERRIKSYRLLLSDYVIGLDNSIYYLDELHAAIISGGQVTLSQQAGIAARAVKLETVADSAKRHLSELDR